MRLSKDKLIFFAEYAFVLLAMLLISDALTPLLYPPSREALDLGDSNSNRLFLATVVYLIALVLLVPRLKFAAAYLLKRPELVLLIVLPLASIFWAADTFPVARRASAHALTITFCLYVVTRYSADEFMERLLITFLIGMCASVILCLLVPQISVHLGSINHGAWFGVYGHKAIAGRMCAVSFFVALLYTPPTKMMKLVKITTLAATIILCVGTQARASWLLIIFGGGVMCVVQLLRMRRLSVGIRLIIVCSVIAAMVILGTATFSDLLLAMGRDASLSGRTTLWNAATAVAADNHPWLGAGYRDFWLGPSVELVQRYMTSWARMPAHGHNGYLDTWLELGWCGLAILIFFLVRTVAAVLVCAVRQPESNVWPVFAVCCLIFIVNNISATVALRHTDAAWVLIVVGSLYAARFAISSASDRRAIGNASSGGVPDRDTVDRNGGRLPSWKRVTA
jgi:O-antigen ligase